MGVLKELRDKAKAVNWKKDSRNEFFIMYSKSGFTDELIEYAKNNTNVFLRQL